MSEAKLAGRVAVVTGGSYGIGRATALRLAQEGASVAIMARGAQRLDETIALLEAIGGADRCMAVQADVSIPESVSAAFDQVRNRFGGFDIVVSNAGSHFGAPIEDTSVEQWRLMLDTHAGGSFFVSQQAFREWKGRGIGGQLVFVTSKSAVAATPKAAAYSAAKAAQLHLGRCLAEEGGPFGIRVNMVLPDGVIRGTGIFTPEQRINAAKRHGVAPDKLEDFYRQRNALKVSITPEEVAKAVLFLCCDDSAVINGAALTVDGGVVGGYVR